MKSFLLINMKMPTIVGIFTFISGENFMFSQVEHEKKNVYNLGAKNYSNIHVVNHSMVELLLLFLFICSFCSKTLRTFCIELSQYISNPFISLGVL